MPYESFHEATRRGHEPRSHCVAQTTLQLLKKRDLAKKVKPAAVVQLKQTVFNFNDDQDLQVIIGYDIVKKGLFATLRENNWTVTMLQSGRWNAEYAL